MDKLSPLAWNVLARLPKLPCVAVLDEIAFDELPGVPSRAATTQIWACIRRIQETFGRPLGKAHVVEDGKWTMRYGWGIRPERWAELREKTIHALQTTED